MEQTEKNIQSESMSWPTSFKYLGKGGEFAVIYFKNILLTIFTLGLYYPWAKVEILSYHYQSTELENSRFNFHGTGKEVFKGYIKVYFAFLLVYGFLIYGTSTQDPTMSVVSVLVFYAFVLSILPLAIHGMARYRSSRSSWRGIHFRYLGNRAEFYKLCLKGFFLTIITFGIYGAWLQVSIRQYVLSHLKFGNLEFDFKGKGGDLLWINVKFILLVYLTLGIYTFWYVRNLWKFMTDNVVVKQDGKEVNFNIDVSPGKIFELLFVNALIIIFTLGLGTPWVAVRTLSFVFKYLEIENGIDFDKIEQGAMDDYGDAAGEDALDFLDLDLL